MRIYYQKTRENEEENRKIEQIEVTRISPNPNQPRKLFSEDSIIKLADSIRQYGIIQPLTVRSIGENYELVAGERRLRAARELGLSAVPCIVIDISDEKSAEISIIENLLRENLNIFEQAEAIEALIDTYGLTQEQIATRLSNSQSFVANKLRLLRLTKEERELILENSLTERHARALLRIPDTALRDKILGIIIAEGLNVALTESLVDRHISRKDHTDESHKTPSRTISAFYSTITKAIDSIKSQGINIKSRRVDGEEYTELTILIPKTAKEPEKV